MHPEAESELAYVLLIELLSHQFAYPVRWIETQNTILGEIAAERIVEVGPLNILTNMMKRTWEHSFQEEDLARGVNRRILGPHGDQAEIYYLQSDDPANDGGAQEHQAPPNIHESAPKTIQSPPTQNAEELKPSSVHSSPNWSSEELPDIKCPISSIVLAIVATKLKKNPHDIQMSRTISSLVGGRSALTNEIIGDLHSEFRNKLPDKAEEIALDILCETLKVQHSGRFGKQAELIISRMISSKFPPDYAQSNIRQILQDKWGLGPMRQDAVLMNAFGQQPSSRISSSEAQKFLSDLAIAYFQEQGLPLPSSGSSNTQTMIIDANTLQAMDKKNSELAREIMGIMQSHLQDTGKSGATNGRSDEATANTVQLLDLWVSEHGEDYAEGIIPKFDAKKQRVYDSYWNWNAQDISLLFELYRDPQVEKNADLINQLSISIMNRACDRSNAQINYLLSKAKTDEETNISKSMQMLYEACLVSRDRDPVFLDRSVDKAPLTTIESNGNIIFREVNRNKRPPNSAKAARLRTYFPVSNFQNGIPIFSHEHSMSFAIDLKLAKRSGLTFRGKNVLLNGASKNSIGSHILRHLLEGGARVTLTTSSYCPETAQFYQGVYARYGGRDSVLRVLPYNQGSHNDVRDLVQHLDADPAWDLDYIIPFAAIPEKGRGLEDLDSRSEIAHRLMLTNLLRLLGGIARSKRTKRVTTRPATIVLPLSQNHGLMGNDGLYSESKRSLETLLAKWSSESWGEYLSLLGVVIGWTRGTGLMDDNDIVAQAVEDLGVRTFAADEMAANIVCLIGGSLNAECQLGPLLVDIGGGMGKVEGFKEKLAAIRGDMHAYADTLRALEEERLLESSCVTGHASEGAGIRDSPIKANIRLPLPALPDYDRDIGPLAYSLGGMVDLSRVVVITGFSELGPYGSSRTRWEMEANGTLSLEGCIEMAWMMGLIRYRSGTTKNSTSSSDWVDAKTLLPINDNDVPGRYMLSIFEHTGIRLIEPEICDNDYNPEHKESMQEILLQHDLPPFETSTELAKDIRRQHGDKAIVTTDASGTCYVQLKTGAAIMVPRASRFDRTVAGQIPTGWSPKRYGISDDIIEQVDPVTLFSLVCTVEALLCSGITDPYELYQHVHVSEVGNCIGSSMGGLSSLRKMHRERFIDKSVKGDILQETFINTTGAWINMLLMSASGPIKTPVGACATSLESLDTGYDLIVAKKAKVCLVGGVEDFVEDVSFEFGSMKATCNTDAEFAAGRSPREMSRPTASTRNGFVESQGCGVQVLTSAELALQMGLPIFGVVAYTNMSADKAGRSVPAPGKGVLTNAREQYFKAGDLPEPLLDLNHRRRLLSLRRRQIADWRSDSIACLDDEISMLTHWSEEDRDEYRREGISVVEEESKEQEAEATFNLGNQFWKSDRKHRISPIRGSLATWGLGIDDISVASLHGTSTVQNDLNETLVIEKQMQHLGRQEGNLLLCVCQKFLTGHSKGAAGAWILNGCLQMMNEGLVPGNRNADNIDQELRDRRHLQFPSNTLDMGGSQGIKACSITSFGFGQKGAQALLVHPRYVLATIPVEAFEDYVRRRDMRWRLACRSFSEAMVNENMVSRCIKTQPPYAAVEEMAVLLDPDARF